MISWSPFGLVCLWERKNWIQLLFRKVQNALITKWLSTALSQMSILIVGSSPGRGMRLNLPIAIVPLRRTDKKDTGFPATGRIFGRRADVAHPRPGSFGSHGHRIDFCESAVLNHFAIKAFCTLWNNNWIFCTLRNNNWIQLLFRKVQNALIAKWLSTTLSQCSHTRPSPSVPWQLEYGSQCTLHMFCTSTPLFSNRFLVPGGPGSGWTWKS